GRPRGARLAGPSTGRSGLGAGHWRRPGRPTSSAWLPPSDSAHDWQTPATCSVTRWHDAHMLSYAYRGASLGGTIVYIVGAIIRSPPCAGRLPQDQSPRPVVAGGSRGGESPRSCLESKNLSRTVKHRRPPGPSLPVGHT